ncbi:hypothetical protein CISIN_1g040310mg, partial [Citrus sinensis]
MEYYLNENFGFVKQKKSEEALERWRILSGFVKNRKRRFRFTANLAKRSEAEAIRRANLAVNLFFRRERLIEPEILNNQHSDGLIKAKMLTNQHEPKNPIGQDQLSLTKKVNKPKASDKRKRKVMNQETTHRITWFGTK